MKKKIFITIFTLLVVLMNSLTAFAKPLEPEYLPTYAESTMTTENNMTKNNATRPAGELVIIDGATTSTAAPTFLQKARQHLKMLQQIFLIF